MLNSLRLLLFSKCTSDLHHGFITSESISWCVHLNFNSFRSFWSAAKHLLQQESPKSVLNHWMIRIYWKNLEKWVLQYVVGESHAEDLAGICHDIGKSFSHREGTLCKKTDELHSSEKQRTSSGKVRQRNLKYFSTWRAQFSSRIVCIFSFYLSFKEIIEYLCNSIICIAFFVYILGFLNVCLITSPDSSTVYLINWDWYIPSLLWHIIN
jgi:hypothetical protein